ncbi:MAG: bacillithiol biosynthesis deacetylase BshB1 [Bacteroidetes bacterium]|nr:bacillithiol biosynthesis deacetylase BshB1 [Bacteroidota bacterium]
MKLDLLVLAAHPDDAELGCSGTVVRAIRDGKKVGIIDLTRGELGTRGTAEIRASETAEATRILGLHVRENLGLADGMFLNTPEQRLPVIRAIRKYKPELVITNAPQDRHPDHGRAAALVSEACFYAGLSKIETLENGSPQTAWRPRSLFHFVQSVSLAVDFVVDISEVWDVKLASIKAYKSQFWDPQSKEPETFISSQNFLRLVEARAVEHGTMVGAAYGEGFIRSRVHGVKSLFDLI